MRVNLSTRITPRVNEAIIYVQTIGINLFTMDVATVYICPQRNRQKCLSQSISNTRGERKPVKKKIFKHISWSRYYQLRSFFPGASVGYFEKGKNILENGKQLVSGYDTVSICMILQLAPRLWGDSLFWTSVGPSTLILCY